VSTVPLSNPSFTSPDISRFAGYRLLLFIFNDAPTEALIFESALYQFGYRRTACYTLRLATKTASRFQLFILGISVLLTVLQPGWSITRLAGKLYAVSETARSAFALHYYSQQCSRRANSSEQNFRCEYDLASLSWCEDGEALLS